MRCFVKYKPLLFIVSTAVLARLVMGAQSQDQQSLSRPTHSQKNFGKSDVSPRIYEKWLSEDVVYIITQQERSDFQKLTTAAQCDKFVDDFWERRNPNPGSAENVFKKEHYQRFAYANQHFAAKAPGWKTDRGRIYIKYGPPDQIDRHYSAAGAQNSKSIIDSGAIPYDWELWHYRHIDGIGNDVAIKFVDTCACGEYQIPIEKDDLNKYKPE